MKTLGKIVASAIGETKLPLTVAMTGEPRLCKIGRDRDGYRGRKQKTKQKRTKREKRESKSEREGWGKERRGRRRRSGEQKKKN